MKMLLLTMLTAGALSVNAQNSETKTIESIYKNALTSEEAYNNLKELCTKAPGRLLGSKASETAIQLLQAQIEKLHPDTCYRQTYRTNSWRSNAPAQATISYAGKKEKLRVVDLGLSVCTPNKGIEAGIVEIHSPKELDSLGTNGIKGKIVFFNRPMNNAYINAFSAYGEAVDQRSGAADAARYGAIGAIVRSIAIGQDDFPHTGVGHYKTGVKQIVNIAVSTNDADKLSSLNKLYPNLKLWIKNNTEMIDTLESANLIAEIKGCVHPDSVILISAHMDSWFNTPGAHDDGAGCARVIDVLRLFEQLGIKPQNTIRFVLYMDEEMLQSGARAYADFVGKEKKKHIACIETDSGGDLPLGFKAEASDQEMASLKKQAEKLADFGVYRMEKGHGGVDINFLEQYGFPLIGVSSNSQRYFDYHHSANDTADKVNRREMQLGSASIASLVYLIDKNGL